MKRVGRPTTETARKFERLASAAEISLSQAYRIINGERGANFSTAKLLKFMWGSGGDVEFWMEPGNGTIKKRIFAENEV